MSGLRRLSIVLGIAGLALATSLIAWFGAGTVWHEVVSVGPLGLATVCAWQMLLFAALGFGWFMVTPPGERWPVGLFVWARMVRDGASNCLPFSQVGGIVFGIRVAIQHGMPWSLAAASTAADVTAEFIAQIALIAAGGIILADHAPQSPYTEPLVIGVVIAMVAVGAFIWLQRGAAGVLTPLSRRILGMWHLDAEARMNQLQAEMTRIYGNPARVAASVVIHCVSWFGTGVASWIAFRLVGSGIRLLDALAIEALLHAVLASAVLVPGYAGVQEAAYVGIGALFGQSADVALGVSLLRRARDLALGIPILLIWQASELRQHRASAARERAR